MGAPANLVWLPLLLLAMMIMPTAPLVIAQKNDTASSGSESSSPSSTTISTSPSPVAAAANGIAASDDSKSARVDQIDREQADQPAEPKSPEGGPYDVIDVLAATSAGAGSGQPKSGQTTRIYTTGEVNDDFWLKHLGEDFKHAIHLQVGNTNDDYNRIANQTDNNGVHEEVHHEYLPGAERPSDTLQHSHNHYRHDYHQQQEQQQPAHDAGYGQTNINSEAYKDNYVQQQEQQYAQGYGQLHSAHYNNRQQQLYNTDTHAYPHIQHNTYNTHNTHNTHDTHIHTRTHDDSKSRHDLRHLYKPNTNIVQSPPAESSIINSSEDTLHTAQTQTAPTSAITAASSSSSLDSSQQLPFKSPFNDYGNRPTRDVAYLLYKRGL